MGLVGGLETVEMIVQLHKLRHFMLGDILFASLASPTPAWHGAVRSSFQLSKHDN